MLFAFIAVGVLTSKVNWKFLPKYSARIIQTQNTRQSDFLLDAGEYILGIRRSVYIPW